MFRLASSPRGKPVREPELTLFAALVDLDRLPDSALRAGLLDKAGRIAEAGEAEGQVFAHERVGVVLAHGGRSSPRQDAKRFRIDVERSPRPGISGLP